MGNVKVGTRSVPVSKNGFTAYVHFHSAKEALDFPTEITVEGDTVKLYHRGRYECTECGGKGHSADYHEQHVVAQKREARKKKLYRQRKKAKTEARRNAS